MKKFVLPALLVTILSISATSAMAEYSDKDGGKGHHRSGKMFEKMDSNKDGVVTKEESVAFQEQKFAKLDGNKDGKITKEEIKASHEARLKEKCDELKD